MSKLMIKLSHNETSTLKRLVSDLDNTFRLNIQRCISDDLFYILYDNLNCTDEFENILDFLSDIFFYKYEIDVFKGLRYENDAIIIMISIITLFISIGVL